MPVCRKDVVDRRKQAIFIYLAASINAVATEGLRAFEIR
jgi:hypothetical protein